MANNTCEMIDDKVLRSLKRLGFDDCETQDFREGRLVLFCPNTTRNDQSLIHVSLRLIAGVNSVDFVTSPNS